MRIYLSIQNAFLLTKYDGMNPKMSSNVLNKLRQEIDATFYPVPRTFNIGLNIETTEKSKGPLIINLFQIINIFFDKFFK